MPSLSPDGYKIHRQILKADEVEELREEASRVAERSGKACAREICSGSRCFRALAEDARMRALIPDGLQRVRSLLFDKTPEENWPVGWHQDLTIAVAERVDVPGYGPWSEKGGVAHVQPGPELMARITAIRIHLDDATEDNGALRVIPGSHRLGRIPPENVGDHLGGESVTCVCAAGDVLVMAPLILHSSRRSRVPFRRRVVHFEYAEVEALDPRLAWHEAEAD